MGWHALTSEAGGLADGALLAAAGAGVAAVGRCTVEPLAGPLPFRSGAGGGCLPAAGLEGCPAAVVVLAGGP